MTPAKKTLIEEVDPIDADEAATEFAPPPVHVALAHVMRDVQAIAKSETGQGVSYNFRGIDSVMNAVGPQLRRHGVIVLPEHLSTTARDYTTKTGTIMRETRVRVRYRFIGPAGDELCAVVEGESSDASDKSTAQAFSVAYRTCLLQALTIPTHDPEPDAQRPERGHAIPEPVPMLTARQIAALDEQAQLLPAGHPKRDKWYEVRDHTAASGYQAILDGLMNAYKDLAKDGTE